MKIKKKGILVFYALSFLSLVGIYFIDAVYFPGASNNEKTSSGLKVEETWSGKLLKKDPKVTRGVVSDSGKCDEMRKEIDGLFDDARKCESDTDCVVENRGMFCPFGCYQIHNKNYNIDDIMEKVMKFQESKCYMCEYSCMIPPSKEELKCHENRCTDIRYEKKK